MWDPATGKVDQRLIDEADVVINLSGESIQKWPRTKKRAVAIRQSRLDATSTLANAVAHSRTPAVFLSGSGMSYYGVERGDNWLAESAEAGPGFLPEVTHVWEAAAEPAVAAGARVAYLRTSIVLDAEGGALRLMLPAFKAYAGAKLGPGTQYFSHISRTDWVRAVAHLVESEVSGPVNLATPNPVTNAEFTKALASALGTKAVFTAPSFVLRAALGGLADDLLGSLRLQPSVLLDSGFTFSHPDIASVLVDALA